ncbi:MAG: hypothetical protein LBQ11_01885, partial [Candidatus Nomurabacteria bacterium]|nr:hypothetical protein [Candidatus Nomurabacteria bacterium]
KSGKKKSKKLPLIITSIVGGVLVLAGIGFAIWWFAYYNSDKKILNDAFYSLLGTTEGTGEIKMSATVDETTIEANIKANYNKDAVAIDVDGKATVADMSIRAGLSLVASGSKDIYVKVNDLKSVLDAVGVGGFDVSKISNKWIKVSSDELTGMVPQAGADSGDISKCMENVATTLTKEKSAQKEILDAITDSKILTAKRVGSDKDGIKFSLAGDLNGTGKFVESLVKTKFYQVVSDCVKTLDGGSELPALPADMDWNEVTSQISPLLEQVDINVYFWVSSWGHQPTHLSVDVKVSEPNIKFTLDVTNKIGKSEVTIPTSSISLTEAIQELMGQFNPYDF